MIRHTRFIILGVFSIALIGTSIRASAQIPNSVRWKDALVPPFTLVWSVSTQKVNPQTQQALLLNYKKQQYEDEVRRGIMSQQEANKMLEAIASQTPSSQPIVYKVTLSADRNGHLLYIDTNLATKETTHVLYNGKETYVLDLHAESNAYNVLQIYPQFAFYAMSFFPLAAADYPYVPLFQGPVTNVHTAGTAVYANVKTAVLRVKLSENKIDYIPAQIEGEITNNRIFLKRTTNFVEAGVPSDRWEYSNFITLNDARLASVCKWTTWQSPALYSFVHPHVDVDSVTDFTLIKASPHALDARQFNPKNWLPKLSDDPFSFIDIMDYRTDPPKQARFTHGNQSSSLDEILAHAQKTSPPIDQESNHVVPIGFLAVAVGLIVLGGVLLWRQARQRHRSK
ncbi:MAG TPA: hypothetical protein VKV18_07080 [Chthonomonas sp.]|uniref:hypothetical protein n=1 Tax=Chthonomonas sp. TaxID=2282153 RepID=UPI002B4ADBA8|nr:hypothetical protein [Chthonomonas sp.]HLI48429.1 hypothetical protein [Chthonomonas sp.]